MDNVTINHIGISGGKDSTALLLWARNESGYPPDSLRASFCDTGNEAPETYDYVRMLSETVHPIQWIKPPLDFYALAAKKHRFPSAKARFCTEALKITPTRKYLQGLVAEGYVVLAHSGVRAGESTARKGMAAREEASESMMGVPLYRPLLDWTLEGVWAIHARYGIPRNPLYDLGAERVGCLPCIMSRKSELLTIALNMPERFDMIRQQEQRVGEERGDGISTFFARDKVPLRYRSKVVTTSVKELNLVGATARDAIAFFEEAEEQGQLFEIDQPGGVIRTGGEQMAVATIDDVIRWAMDSQGRTGVLDLEDVEEMLVCSSGMCE